MHMKMTLIYLLDSFYGLSAMSPRKINFNKIYNLSKFQNGMAKNSTRLYTLPSSYRRKENLEYYHHITVLAGCIFNPSSREISWCFLLHCCIWSLCYCIHELQSTTNISLFINTHIHTLHSNIQLQENNLRSDLRNSNRSSSVSIMQYINIMY